jgi:VanZ family protein
MGSVLIYMGVLALATMTSPGVGILGGLISMLPQPVTDMSHVPAYGLLTWLLWGLLARYGWPRHLTLCIAITSAFVFGIWMELCQAFVPGRVADNGDVMMNGIGIVTAALLILWRGMSANNADKLVPARSCTHVH